MLGINNPISKNGAFVKKLATGYGYPELASLRRFYPLKQQGSYRAQYWNCNLIYKLRVITVQGFSRKKNTN